MILRLFISGVQKELAEERAALRDYLRGDVLLRRLFEVFLFKEVPAADQRADACYLDEVQRCDIIRRKASKYPPSTQQVPNKYRTSTEQVRALLETARNAKSRAELMGALNLKDRVNFADKYLEPAPSDGLIEMTQPNLPRSPTQKYRPTQKGCDWLAAQGGQS